MIRNQIKQIGIGFLAICFVMISAVVMGQDTDGDTVDDATDNCVNEPNLDQADIDADGVGDVCDVCQGDDATGDADNDAVIVPI